ncbi:MAG: hypothetical protein HRU28_05575 [Rhizobiales bacterium]|nr:hypothetical protein [Hyphomicrobiales bacterium]
MDKINYIVSAGAITSFGWMPKLEEVSTHASLWLPIVGVIWISVQIWFKFKNRGK